MGTQPLITLQAFITRLFEMQRDDLQQVIGDLSQVELEFQPSPSANPIGFLLWHMVRVEDGWIQRVIQGEKHLWVRAGWARRFGMTEDQRDMGYNYSEEQVRDFKVPNLTLLIDYFNAVRGGTLAFLTQWDSNLIGAEHRAPWGGTISTTEILSQLVWELNQHAGQVAYLLGLQRGLQRPDYMGPLSLSK